MRKGSELLSQDKTILILGYNSFSGNVLARFLIENKYSVIGITRNREIPFPYKANYREDPKQIHCLGDNFNPSTIVDICNTYKVTHVINFVAQSMVAQSWENPELWYDTNVTWLSLIARELNAWGKIEKFIQFTTPEVYGSTNRWQSESWVFAPSTPYAVSRAAGDWHLKCLGKEYGFPVIFTRTANIYGPHQPLYRVVPKALMMAKKAEKFPLEGGGSSTRSFIYMEDVAKALLIILDRGKLLDTYHISTKETISISNLVSKIYEMYDLNFDNFKILLSDRKGKDSAYLLDSGKIRTELSWNDVTTLESGLNSTKKWVDDNFEELERLPRIYG